MGNIHVHFFVKIESGSINGYIESLVYWASLIPAGGLEIPFLLTFLCHKEDTVTLMKGLLITLYSWIFTGKMKEDNSSKTRSKKVKK